MSRSKDALKDTLINTENEARKRGLLVNGNKTKYMQVARAVQNDEHLFWGQHKFEHVKEIFYLGSKMNQTNCISSEIQARILNGNRCYYAYEKLMKSRALNKLKVKNIQKFNKTCSDLWMWSLDADKLRRETSQNIRA